MTPEPNGTAATQPGGPLGDVPAAGAPVRLRGRTFTSAEPLVMAIINRTSDSFYPGARQLDDDVAWASVQQAIAEGADIIDVGGIKAAPGEEISVAEEIDRVMPFIATVRAAYPDIILSCDTYRAEVAQAAIDNGADLMNDTWGGHDPDIVTVAAAHDAGVVVSHTGGVQPRTRPHRVRYGAAPDDVVTDVCQALRAGAARAVSAGVHPHSVLIDPTHDFGKNTWHGLALLRHADQLSAIPHPVLMALSRKDFIGETLDVAVEDRLWGSLGATAVAVWLGARVVRCHDVAATRGVVDMVASIRGERPPSAVVRGLA